MSEQTAAPWGASASDWAHFADVLQLTEDLLPVVSNPHAKLHASSKLQGLGKVPSRYAADGTVVGIPRWTQAQTTGRQVAGWAGHPDLGICVQTRRVRAIDIDIADPVHSGAVAEVADMVLGALPARVRPNSGKMLLVFRLAGEMSKRVIRTAHGVVELLATGQQIIAVGTHPTGVRYEWTGGLPDTIPEVTLAELEQFWSAIEKMHGVVSTTDRRGTLPAVVRSMADVADGMVKWLGDNGWAVGYDNSGRVDIRCPWEHEHTADSGPTATSYFPAGVGGFARGHFRCLHAHCSGRGDEEFLDEMGIGVSSEFEPIPDMPVPSSGRPGELVEWAEAGPLPALDRAKGKIQCTAANMKALVARPDLLHAKVGYDTFRDVVMIVRPGDKAWRPLRDTDYFDLRCEFERLKVVKPAKETVRDAVLWAAWEHRFDSAQMWAQALRWDGQARVQSFMHRYLGCEDDCYTQSVGTYLWTALAGRCLEPGCKVDMVPVLISREGTGKTSLVETLAPSAEMFVEINLEHRDADLARSLRGKLVAELAELRGLAGRESEAIKAWITRRHEEWVPKYVEFATVYPRRFVPIGTANTEEFLPDEEGGRRWLPVRVGETDREGIRRDVAQLWAEGVQLFKKGGVRWRDAEELAREHLPDFKQREPWTPLIASWLESADDLAEDGVLRKLRPVSLVDVLMGAVGLHAGQIARQQELRAGRALKALGYEKKVVRDGANIAKRWLSVEYREKHGIL